MRFVRARGARRVYVRSQGASISRRPAQLAEAGVAWCSAAPRLHPHPWHARAQRCTPRAARSARAALPRPRCLNANRIGGAIQIADVRECPHARAACVHEQEKRKDVKGEHHRGFCVRATCRPPSKLCAESGLGCGPSSETLDEALAHGCYLTAHTVALGSTTSV